MSRIYSNGGRPSLGLLAIDMFDDSEMLTTEKDSVWIEFSYNWPKQNSVASYISVLLSYRLELCYSAFWPLTQGCKSGVSTEQNKSLMSQGHSAGKRQLRP